MKDSKVKVKLNSSGVQKVLKSQFMMDAVMSEALKHGEIDTSFVGIDRVHVIVDTGKDNKQ